jgi:cytochrome P450
MMAAGSPLAALQVFNDELGDVFCPWLPGFSPTVLVGPEAARFVLVDARKELRWRNEDDPITRLLGHGLLVEDGDIHNELRRLMNPIFHRRMLGDYLHSMWQTTNDVLESWPNGSTVDMLIEMRKITLLILTRTLFRTDLSPDLDRLWAAVLSLTRYISPGAWIFWKGVPRPGYKRAIRQMDIYLYSIIKERRLQLNKYLHHPLDLLTKLVTSNLPDDLVRDQLLTMIIAGHDTSTALLAWTLYLLGEHPHMLPRLRGELGIFPADQPPTLAQLGQLNYLDMVIRESLRLYPPAHLGSRIADRDLDFQGFSIPKGSRVIYSIYLTQRQEQYWQNPHDFIPERHTSRKDQTPYSWLAFGGGPRTCIGSAFGLMEAKVILAIILKRFDLQLLSKQVRPHMGATLEPHPSVKMKIMSLNNTTAH